MIVIATLTIIVITALTIVVTVVTTLLVIVLTVLIGARRVLSTLAAVGRLGVVINSFKSLCVVHRGIAVVGTAAH